MAKTILRSRAMELRREGQSYKGIAKKIRVSTSTISLWCRNIQLSKEKIDELERRSRDPYYGRRWNYIKSVRERTLEKVEKLSEQGRKQINTLSKRELMIAGTALYWAEGFKKDKMAGFSNTDPDMVRFIIKWFIECLEVKKEDFRLRVVINESHRNRMDEIMNFWVKETGISSKYFYNPTFQKVTWKKVYENSNTYHGVLRVRILKSTDILRKIMGMIVGLGENI